MVIEGPPDYVRGYLCGFVQGRAQQADLQFADQIDVEDGGLLERLAAKIGLEHALTHVIVDAETAKLVAAALAAEGEHRLRLHSERSIVVAAFDYRYAVFNREQAEAVTKALQSHGPDITLVDHEEKRREDPEAEEVELYTAAHDFELKGHGRAVGPLDQIIALRRELKGIEQAEVKRIELTFA